VSELVGKRETTTSGSFFGLGKTGVDAYGKFGFTDAAIEYVYDNIRQTQTIKDGQQTYADVYDLREAGRQLLIISPDAKIGYNVYGVDGEYEDANIDYGNSEYGISLKDGFSGYNGNPFTSLLGNETSICGLNGVNLIYNVSNGDYEISLDNQPKDYAGPIPQPSATKSTSQNLASDISQLVGADKASLYMDKVKEYWKSGVVPNVIIMAQVPQTTTKDRGLFMQDVTIQTGIYYEGNIPESSSVEPTVVIDLLV